MVLVLAHHPLRQLVSDRRRAESLLRVPGMRSLIAATLISSLGSSTALLAVAWVSYQHSDSIVHTVIVATAYSIPAVVLGPTAGRLAEAHQRRQIIAWCYVGHMVVWNGVAFLDIIGWLTPAWLALAMLLGGTCSALRFPSWQQFERSMVPDARLHEANALFVSVRSMARIVGAVVGGFVITWIGPGSAFAFNALSFLPFALIIAAQREPRRTPTRRAKNVRRRETVAYIRTEPTVRLAILMIVLLTLLAVPIASLLPAIADQIDDGAHALGVVTAFYAVGGSLVALVLRRIREEYPKVRLVGPVVVLCGGSLVIIGLLGDELGGAGRLISVVGLLLPIGLGLAIARAVLSSLVQLNTTPEMEGHVLALYGASVSLVTPIGGLTLAAITELTSVWVSVALAGVLLLIVAVVIHVVRPAALIGSDHARHHAVALDHASHFTQFVDGFIDPAQIAPQVTLADSPGGTDDSSSGATAPELSALTVRPAGDPGSPADPAAPRRGD